MAFGILFDQNLCIGCGTCEIRCQEEHKIKIHKAEKLDENTFTFVEEVASGTFQRHLCMHCLNPACASACPVSALRQMENGAIIYDPNICLGCRYCMFACPFNIPKYEYKSPVPRVRKCDFCYETKTSKGLEPPCASSCPTGATLFGEREELLKTAYERITKEKEKYVEKIYGEKEVGGTSVLFLKLKEGEKAKLSLKVPEFPLPNLTDYFLKKTPIFILILGGFLGGMNFLTRRKNEIKKEKEKNEK